MIQAFNLAEKYQLVVIVLTDKHLNESHKSTKKFDLSAVKIERGKIVSNEQLIKLAQKNKEYKRFSFTEDGVSPRAFPGQQHGIFMSSSDEHTEDGVFNEREENRKMMMDKRMQKLHTAKKDILLPKLIGDKNADITIISFGSTKGAILEAMQILHAKSIKANFLQLKFISPFPENIAQIIKSAKKTICIECNQSGQLASIIKEQTGLDVTHKLLKYDGRPFYPEEIYDAIKTYLIK